MNTRRKSTLFLVEQLIVVAVFALCAVACISILTTSFFMANDSKDTANALIAAQNCAEAFKAAGGDINLMGTLLGSSGSIPTRSDDTGFSYVLYYDNTWQPFNSRPDNTAEFILTLSGTVSVHDDTGIIFRSGEVIIDKISGERLVSFPVAARG